MKIKSLLFITITFLFFSCTKKNQEQEVNLNTTKNKVERKSSTCAITTSSTTLRGLDYANTTAYSGTFTRNADNSVTASISSVTSLTTDRQAMYAMDNSTINTTTNSIDIPTSGTYWYIPFDISETPVKLTGGDAVTYRCDCKNGGTGDCNVEINDCKVSCHNESCTQHCCLEEEEPVPVRPVGGSGVILETIKLILNGTVYE